MKGCVIILRESAPILHEISEKLHSKYGVRSFCFYTQSEELEQRIKHLNHASDINILREDLLYARAEKEKLNIGLLRRFEKEYGKPFLWPYIIGEKTLMYKSPARVLYSYEPAYSYEDMLKIVQVFFSSIEKFLQEEKPDFLLMAGVGSLPTHIFYEIAKSMGIKILDIQTARIKNRVLATKDFTHFLDTEKIFNKLLADNPTKGITVEAKKFVQDFRDKPETYGPIFFSFGIKSRFKFLSPDNLKKTIKTIFVISKLYISASIKGQRNTYPNPLRLLFELVAKKIRSLIIPIKYYEKPTKEELFGFFPLQVEPEVANAISSPYYVDQIELVRYTAKSLPVGFKLYVKEHPMMRGVRKLEYYKKLKQIPNVTLVDDAIPSLDLLKNSKIVLTNVSTVGWEALLLKKPVVTFGNIFYNSLSFVKKCNAIEELPYIVKELLESTTDHDRELLCFVSALFKDSTNFNFMKFLYKPLNKKTVDLVKEEDGFNDFVHQISEKLKDSADKS